MAGQAKGWFNDMIGAARNGMAGAVQMNKHDVWKSALDSFTLEEVLRGSGARQLVTLKHTDTIEEALQVLASNNIISAPVVIPAPKRAMVDADDIPPVDTLLGFLDVGDLLKAFIAATTARLGPAIGGVQPWKEALMAVGQEFAQKKVLGFTGNDAEVFYKANLLMTLREVVSQGFLAIGRHHRSMEGGDLVEGVEPNSAPGQHTTHRLAVFGNDGRIAHVISQSDVIRHIYSNMKVVGHSRDELTIEDMGLTRKERGVVCARIDEATHDVFAIMYANRVSAVGILNDQGDLVANLSASDLRRIQPQHFSLLALPVGHFLSRLHSASSTVFCSTSTDDMMRDVHIGTAVGTVGLMGHSLPEIVTCQPNTPLSEVLKMFVEKRKHRIYVTAPGSKKPISVITATDILRYLCEPNKPTGGGSGAK